MLIHRAPKEPRPRPRISTIIPKQYQIGLVFVDYMTITWHGIQRSMAWYALKQLHESRVVLELSFVILISTELNRMLIGYFFAMKSKTGLYSRLKPCHMYKLPWEIPEWQQLGNVNLLKLLNILCNADRLQISKWIT